MKYGKLLLAVALATVWGVVSLGYAAPFTEGNLVVTQIDFADTWGDNAGAVNLVEFSTTAATPAVQSVQMPTAVSGANKRFTLPAGYFRAGHLSRSGDGRYLVLGGYDADVGTEYVATTLAADVNRVVGRVNANGNINTTTALTDCYQGGGGDFRAATSSDGTKFWLAGRSDSSSDACTRFTTLGSTTSVQLDSGKKIKDPRTVNVYNGELYVGSNYSGRRGAVQFGYGLPETPILGAEVMLIAPSPGDSQSAYDVCLIGTDILYIADDRDELNYGGLEKFVYNSVAGTWDYQYTLNQGLFDVTDRQMLRSVTGTVDEFGNPVLYAITAEDDGFNRLVSVTDTGAGSLFATLQTAPEGTIFRGVEWAPVPEPTTGLSFLALVALWLRRRRRS